MTRGVSVHGSTPPGSTWVLLEGASDVAAVRALRAARGVPPAHEPCRLVDMGGATNIRRHLEAAAAGRPRPHVVGLCDEREAGFFVRALEAVRPLRAGDSPALRPRGADRHGDRRSGASDDVHVADLHVADLGADAEASPIADVRAISIETLPEHGFQICRRDLEDELLRALGPTSALSVLADVGLGETFAAFIRQPAWQGRPVLDQLHRFCGTTSGRKELLAGALADALDDASCPPPLAALLASMPRA